MEGNPITLKRLLFRKVAAYLLISGNSAVLVDTGFKGSSEKVLKALGEHGLSASDLRLIILTHAHYDHTGGLEGLLEITDAKVVIHRLESEALKKGRSTVPEGTRWKGRLIAFLARNVFTKVLRFPAVDPDILVEDRHELSEWDMDAYLVHTPGHTRGSISVILGDGRCIAGDTMLGFARRHFPPFAENKYQVLNSWKMLLDEGCTEFYPAHGFMIKRKAIENELPDAIKRYGTGDQSARNSSSKA